MGGKHISVDVTARLREVGEALTDGGPPPGRGWCHAWSDELDAALADLHAAAVPERGRLALVAVGGYGRRELCPGSDVDLLVLAEGIDDAPLGTVAKGILHPLWDAGLKVGHAVRDLRDAVRQAEADLLTMTATLDARHVAGDADMTRRLRDDLRAAMSRRSARHLRLLAEADGSRRVRHGDAAEALEPHVKEGAGGLRDVQSLRWAGAILLGESGLDPLVAAHYLSAPDRSRLSRAEDLLLAVRVALHLEAGRADDRLTLGRQGAVARRLGVGQGARDRADVLLHDVLLAARTVDHVHRCAWRLIDADLRAGRRRLRRVADRVLAGGFTESDGVIRLDDADLDEPAMPTLLLEALADTGGTLDRRSAATVVRWLETRAPTGPDWDAANRQRFLGVLWRGTEALGPLAELDDLGLLEALVPEWAPLRARPQRNPLHRYALDRHLLHTATTVGELVRREPWAVETLEEVGDREGLLFGALLHDIGKAHGEPHGETGVPVARAVAERLGAAPGTVDLVERLVRLHLLLPDTATRRDLTDPGLAREVAEAVGDRATLASLHLLSVADGLSTGSGAWSPWKAQLISTLVEKVRAVLDERDPDDLATAAAAGAHEAQEMAGELGVTADVVRRHLALLPPRYAASVTPRAIVRQAAAAEQPLGPTDVRTRIHPGGDAAGPIDDLDVIARDRPGLFAKVAGVLALHGGSVLSAHAFTREDGVAVDSFTVRRPVDAGGSWWAAVEGDLAEAMAGRLALAARLARKAASVRRPRRAAHEIQTRAEIGEDAAGHATVVEVHTEDGIGVLYRIAGALAELELDVVAAKIDTLGHEVVDVFYVRDAAGLPLDADHADEVRLAVTSALAAS
ncbi:MAG: [protein-PII] uridylyltransferase [Nitriliruptorales bacterium]